MTGPATFDNASASDAKSEDAFSVARTKALIEQIRKLDRQLNVFVHLDEAGALESARIVEAEIDRGKRRGPLHGVPVAIKDIIDVAGMPTTCQSAILRDNIPSSDAEVVRRLRDAGAIILGKVATHEFAMGFPSFDLPFPPARNPWNPEHHPGGSSSGSAAGVASGMFPMALGTDTGGSIRNPSAACGIVGLKPTYGLVSRRGLFPLAQSLDHVGPMARTVKDVAALLQVIAGHDPLDPGSAIGDDQAYDRYLGNGVRSLRIGFVRNFHVDDYVCDPEVGRALDAAAGLFAELGATVEPINLPPLSDFANTHNVILYAEAWAVHADWIRKFPQKYGRSTRRRMFTGAFLSAGDYVSAQHARRHLIASVEQALTKYDVLLCANSLDPAAKIDDEAEVSRTYPRQARTPFNLTGHPAMSIMSGLSSAGLPLSLQLVGRYFDEARLLGVAAAFEAATPWHDRRPPLHLRS